MYCKTVLGIGLESSEDTSDEKTLEDCDDKDDSNRVYVFGFSSASSQLCPEFESSYMVISGSISDVVQRSAKR
jgi:hypothetical protein